LSRQRLSLVARGWSLGSGQLFISRPPSLAPLGGLLALGLLLGGMAGCERPINAAAIRDEVLKADPRFSDALQKRDELASKIALFEQELALKQSQVEGQIRVLRKELSQTRATVNEQIRKTKAVIRPFWERVDLDLSLASQELKLKRNQRASVGGRISAIRKSLKRAQPAWTPEERAKMDRDLEELLYETGRLDAEITTLTQHARLLKLKRLLLRL
jgi:hypothetical protein